MRLGAIVALVVACGKREPDAVPTATIDVAAINALVPAALRDELVFEQRELVTDHTGGGVAPKVTFTAAVPRGWERQPFAIVDDFAALVPPAASKLAGAADLSLKSACKQDGICVAQDGVAWAALAEKEVFGPYRRDGIVIERDDVRATDRLAILRRAADRYLVYAWWRDGGTRFRICAARLASAAEAAAPAFEKACRTVVVTGE